MLLVQQHRTIVDVSKQQHSAIDLLGDIMGSTEQINSIVLVLIKFHQTLTLYKVCDSVQETVITHQCPHRSHNQLAIYSFFADMIFYIRIF